MWITLTVCLLVCMFAACEAATNCSELQQIANGTLISASYDVVNANGAAFKVYCQFYNGYGYAFVSTNTDVDVDMNELFDDKSHVVVRHKRTDGKQYTASLQQLSSFSSTPILVQYNGHTGYQSHQNTMMTPYIYVGFIPEALTNSGETNGWKCKGQEYTFTNCDDNPNSYIVFLFNRNKVGYTSYSGSYNDLLFSWYSTASTLSQVEYLPDEFFTSYYEIHHGGCGGYGTAASASDVTGATVGVKFVTTCAVPVDISYGSKTYTGNSAGSTVTYVCYSGYTVVSGNLIRTCSGTGGWSGVQPICGVHGGWSLWSSWAGCSATCGSGQWSRSRSCDNPAPVNGGDVCRENSTETDTCTLSGCPVDGSWTTWSAWSSCDVTCAGGTSFRTRSCSNPPASNGGLDCMGDHNESTSCNDQSCPIDGSFDDWTQWTTCPVTCGGGSVSRSRSCTNPRPQFGGSNCTGVYDESSACNTNACPVDGAWITWASWSTCSVSCGGGSTIRYRTCTDPAPANNGLDCLGGSNETLECNDQHCPIDGDWDEWTSWSSCDVTCGTGSMQRSRTCTNPTPQYNGRNCVGSVSYTSMCSYSECPVDGNWGPWSPSSCSATCGYGKQSKTRSCDSPLPAYGGSNCTGSGAVTEQCVVTMCTGISPDDYVNQCGDGMFTCHSGRILCIDKDFRCECENDCDDGSDEDVTWAGCDAVQAALCSSADGVHCRGDFFQIAVSVFVLFILTSCIAFA